jgi:hypothetical protein
MKIVFRRVGDRSFLASGLFPESTTGTQSPTLRAVSLQVQLRLGFLTGLKQISSPNKA